MYIFEWLGFICNISGYCCTAGSVPALCNVNNTRRNVRMSCKLNTSICPGSTKTRTNTTIPAITIHQHTYTWSLYTCYISILQRPWRSSGICMRGRCQCCVVSWCLPRPPVTRTCPSSQTPLPRWVWPRQGLHRPTCTPSTNSGRRKGQYMYTWF